MAQADAATFNEYPMPECDLSQNVHVKISQQEKVSDYDFFVINNFHGSIITINVKVEKDINTNFIQENQWQDIQ